MLSDELYKSARVLRVFVARPVALANSDIATILA
jgi:hypothetical protein